MSPDWDKILLFAVGATNLVMATDRYFDWRRKRAATTAGDEREGKVQHVADEKLQAFKEKAIEDRFTRLEADLHEFRGEQKGELRRLHDEASNYADEQQKRVGEVATTLVELKEQIKTLFRLVGQRKGEG